MRVMRGFMAVAAALCLARVAHAGPPSGSYVVEVFGFAGQVRLADQAPWLACGSDSHFQVCFHAFELAQDVFGNITSDMTAQMQFYSPIEPPSSFPMQQTGRVSGTWAHPKAKVSIKGAGPVVVHGLPGTGTGQIHFSCGLIQDFFTCGPATLKFCLTVPGLRDECVDVSHGPVQAIQAPPSDWDLTFQAQTDAKNQVSGTGEVVLSSSGQKIELLMTGKYDPKRDLATFRFVSTPTPGVTLSITRFSEATQPRSGLLQFKIGGTSAGRVDLSTVFTDHTP
jgi:hypothetical protein